MHPWRVSTSMHRGIRPAARLATAACLLAAALSARASDAPLILEHLTTSDGLPQGTVFATLQDSQGFVWLATEDGLVRYDGHELFRYAYSRTAHGGLDVLEPATGRIEHLRHDPGDPSSIIHDHINALLLDRSGTLWVGTEAGLERWQPEHHGFAHLSSVGGSHVARVLQDSSGSLWVGTSDAGLRRLDHAGELLQVLRHDPENPASLTTDDVRALLEDQAGHLWVGTAAGLDMLNRATGQFSHYRHDPSDADSLRDSFVMSLYQDATGLVWIGTRAGGVSRWNPRSWELGGHRPAWLGDKLVTAL